MSDEKMRGKCGVCGRFFNLAKAGVVRVHSSAVERSMNCRGSSTEPTRTIPEATR